MARRAIDLREVGWGDVEARARERDRAATSADHGVAHRMFRRRVDREERMAVRDAGRSSPAVRMALQTGGGVVGPCRVLDENPDAEVIRDHPVLCLRVATVATPLGKVGAWV